MWSAESGHQPIPDHLEQTFLIEYSVQNTQIHVKFKSFSPRLAAYLHDTLHQGLGCELLVSRRQAGCDAELVTHCKELILLIIHRCLDHVEDGLIDELDETSDVVVGFGLLPLAILGIQEVLTPEAIKPLVVRCGCLGSIGLCKLGDRERPSMQTSREAYSALYKRSW